MEKIYFENSKNFYRTYFIDDNYRPLVLISPGGGYTHTSNRESEPVGNVFLNAGYHVVIVNYREDLSEVYPKPQSYLAYLIDKYHNDKRVSKIIGVGFSAGGHNILEVALHYKNYLGNAKLDLLILGYPVVTSDKRYYHEGSFKNLLQDKFDDKKMMEYLSLEREVKSDAPDLFLWGTVTDESVDVMNSLLLVEAYHKVGCNVEYHLFPLGGHGLSVSTLESSFGEANKYIPHVSVWTKLALDWLKLKLES